MNYTSCTYGRGFSTQFQDMLFGKIETDKKLTRTNISPYNKKICLQNQPVGIKFANNSDGNYYALFLIQQQIAGQSNSANLAGQDTGRQLQRGKGSVGYYRCNESS